MYVDDVKLAGKKQNINPTWKVLMKDFDLGEPTSFLDHVYLGCTQRVCQISKDIVDNYRSIFESRISAGATRKICQKRYLHGPMIWKVMQRNAWRDITEQLYKVATPCTDDHQLKEEEKWIIHSLLTNCSEMSKFDTYWSTLCF